MFQEQQAQSSSMNLRFSRSKKNTLPVCVSKRDSADKSKVEQIFVPRQEMYIGKKLHRIAVWYMKKLDAQLTAPPLQLCLCYYVQKKMELECFNTFCTSTSTASTLYFHVSLSLCSLFFSDKLGLYRSIVTMKSALQLP